MNTVGRKTGGTAAPSSGSKLTDGEARLLIAIAGHRSVNGIGPTWAWLRERLDLGRAELDAMLHHLRRRQLVIFGPASGSLSTTDLGRNVAIEWAASWRRRPRSREAGA